MRRLFAAALLALGIAACSPEKTRSDEPPTAPAAQVIPDPDPFRCPPLTFTGSLREKVAEVVTPDKPVIDSLTIENWRVLCAEQPKLVACRGGEGQQLTLAEVVSVDLAFRKTFEYRSDFIQFGRDDVWRAGLTCGDCEDYALELSERLHRAGAAGRTMRLTVLALPEGGHARLQVETSDAGWVEVGVGPRETPQAKLPGVLFGAIPLDGSHRVLVAPGYDLAKHPRHGLLLYRLAPEAPKG